MKTFTTMLAAITVGALAFAGSAMAFVNTAPSAPPEFRIDYTTQTQIAVSHGQSCDQEANFGRPGPYSTYEYQINGVFYASVIANGPNCIFSSRQGIVYSGRVCAHSYTVRVRGIDELGLKRPFSTITGSQGAKTKPC